MKYFLFYVFFISQAFAGIKVITTTSDLAWAVEKIGGDRVVVESLLNGSEDPHYVEAMPHWIVKLIQADVFCMVGLDLEIGWAARILERSGNRKIQPGGKGHCNAGKNVAALEIPTGKINRSMGDIHPAGNPHYHLGPGFYIQAIEGIFAVLMDVDPTGAEIYSKNFQLIKSEMKKLKEEVSVILKPLRNKKFMSYHKEFSYFFHDFNLTSLGEIEENPGIPPSAGRVARMALKAKQNDMAVLLAAKNNPRKIIDRFSNISKTPSVMLHTSIQKDKFPSNYRELILQIAHALTEKP
ncbi:MAG: metal ABC transporter substrate-binding protein [Halobacteriovoraceae bacterium]|nr:metal ABC transporter substrate-binding protein [Halobacteriovoraceae bacterium]